MKKLIFAVALLLVPVSARAQQMLSPREIAPGDKRLEFVQPFADQLVRGDVSSLEAWLEKHASAAAREQAATELAALVEQFGGNRYTVEGFMNGRDRDVVITLKNKADQTVVRIAVILEPDTDKVTRFGQVRMAGGD